MVDLGRVNYLCIYLLLLWNLWCMKRIEVNWVWSILSLVTSFNYQCANNLEVFEQIKLVLNTFADFELVKHDRATTKLHVFKDRSLKLTLLCPNLNLNYLVALRRVRIANQIKTMLTENTLKARLPLGPRLKLVFAVEYPYELIQRCLNFRWILK